MTAAQEQLFPEHAGLERWAAVSDDGVYRYILGRRWNDGSLLGWVMLNPSTADAAVDDPTIRRCCGFARAHGFAGIQVANLYPLRATDPRELLTHPDPVGPRDRYAAALAELTAERAGAVIVCAWGTRGPADRAANTARFLRTGGADLRCLGTTKTGHPRHPLYVRGDQPLEQFEEAPRG